MYPCIIRELDELKKTKLFDLTTSMACLKIMLALPLSAIELPNELKVCLTDSEAWVAARDSNVYVALSRSSGRESIRLLRDFDDSLFTTTPCVVLEEEDKRLEKLDRETYAAWKREEM